MESPEVLEDGGGSMVGSSVSICGAGQAEPPLQSSPGSLQGRAGREGGSCRNVMSGFDSWYNL